ncbi:hypothetical protein OAS06_03650, partial [Gammaproteobacteria bacterium]|nr:hypothetical protein [Gammaproteobacteria bacterium]
NAPTDHQNIEVLLNRLAIRELNVWHENPSFYVGEIGFRLPTACVFCRKIFPKDSLSKIF